MILSKMVGAPLSALAAAAFAEASSSCIALVQNRDLWEWWGWRNLIELKLEVALGETLTFENALVVTAQFLSRLKDPIAAMVNGKCWVLEGLANVGKEVHFHLPDSIIWTAKSSWANPIDIVTNGCYKVGNLTRKATKVNGASTPSILNCLLLCSSNFYSF